jgi:hypothetical protein
VTNSPVTYNGSGQAALVSITASSTPGSVTNILTGGASTQTNANTYSVTATFTPTDTANYNTLTNLSAGSFVINKATPTATLAVTNSPVTYNGSGQAALVSITASSTPGSVTNILTGGAASQTNVGTYAVTADFVPTDTANYNSLTGQSAGSFAINSVTPPAPVTGTDTALQSAISDQTSNLTSPRYPAPSVSQLQQYSSNVANPQVGPIYFYHPLTPYDMAAFGSMVLSASDYQFLNGSLNLTGHAGLNAMFEEFNSRR